MQLDSVRSFRTLKTFFLCVLFQRTIFAKFFAAFSALTQRDVAFVTTRTADRWSTVMRTNVSKKIRTETEMIFVVAGTTVAARFVRADEMFDGRRRHGTRGNVVDHKHVRRGGETKNHRAVRRRLNLFTSHHRSAGLKENFAKISTRVTGRVFAAQIFVFDQNDFRWRFLLKMSFDQVAGWRTRAQRRVNGKRFGLQSFRPVIGVGEALPELAFHLG